MGKIQFLRPAASDHYRGAAERAAKEKLERGRGGLRVVRVSHAIDICLEIICTVINR